MSITGPCQREQEYGYLSYLHHIILGLDEIDRLVHTITKFSIYGLTTLSFLSSFVLKVNSSGVRRLVWAFLHTCVSLPVLGAEH